MIITAVHKGRFVVPVYDRTTDEIRQEQESAKREIERQGCRLSGDQEALETLRGIVKTAFEIFPDEAIESALRFVYLYEQEEQIAEEYKNNCGRCFYSYDETKDGGGIVAIGVSVEAIREGRGYAAMIFLHELAHAINPYTGDHDSDFERLLDSLIERWNKATGEKLKNDYISHMPGAMRHDARFDGDCTNRKFYLSDPETAERQTVRQGGSVRYGSGRKA